MELSIVLSSMNALPIEQLTNEILAINEESKAYGLVLTSQDVAQVLEAGKRSLRQHGRIELGTGVIKSIIHSFCSSSFISPEEYVSTLNELNDIFYYMKNETEDRIGDDELVKMMKEYFETSCEGSLELLRSRLTEFAEDFRRKTDISGLYKEEK
jgi:hypothetical protein